MSKFKLYTINSDKPGNLGRRNKRLVFAYSLLFIVFYFTLESKVLDKVFHLSLTLSVIILSLLILSTAAIIFIMLGQIRKLKKIGTLEFTQTKIRKEIGDLRTEIPIEAINRIELEKHLRAITVFQSSTGSVSYIMKIIRKDNKEEQFVISEKSVDFGQKMSLVNTLNTMKKLANLEVVIKKN